MEKKTFIVKLIGPNTSWQETFHAERLDIDSSAVYLWNDSQVVGFFPRERVMYVCEQVAMTE